MTADEPGTGANAEKLRKRNRELSILNAIAEALNREDDLGRALHTTLGRVAELLGLQTGWVWLLDDGNAGPYLAAAKDLPMASHLAILYALAGEAMVRSAYSEAVASGYLWHEFGDSNLVLPRPG